jgi:predicted AAA+ superfamily ATPase
MYLENLFEKYHKIAKLQHHTYKRYFLSSIDFNDKMVGILGARGTGKTTSIIQHLNDIDIAMEKKLYFSADSISLSGVKLYDIADEFSKSGGKILAIDEIHKYANFENDLKEIYDFLDIQVIFSGSSAMQLEHKKADLSRRAVLYRVGGLSFREFLELKLEMKFKSFTLDEIVSNHMEIADEITKRIKPFEFFGEYLQNGYYPFYFENPNSYGLKLEETINTVIESDLPIIFNIEPQNIQKLKQLVGIVCASKPYELNISALSAKIGINRTTLYQYIDYLGLGNIFYSLRAKSKNDTVFSKPSKLYLNNTNLSQYYCKNQEIGALREQFFASQVRVKHTLHYPNKGDFLIDEKYIFEIGGKNKSFEQIKDLPNSFVAADDIEIGFKNKIPLWLFGFLY